MNLTQARTILSIPQDITKTELKKKYRELMHKVHPDAKEYAASDAPAYGYSAYEINEAYSFMCIYMDELSHSSYDSIHDGHNGHYGTSDDKYQSSNNNHSHYNNSCNDYYNYNKYSKNQNYYNDSDNTSYTWDAPINSNAYCNRNIYHYAENYDGEKIGYFKAARGKYIWTVEEDFKLFIKSIFDCSEELLNDADTRKQRMRNMNSSADASVGTYGYSIAGDKRLAVQAELAYLLAQQYIAAADTIDNILTSLDDASKVYYVAAMLEVSVQAPYIRAGMKLYPSGIRRHRLYLKTQEGKEAGYVSLKDDRLYYILIPVLEQRRAQVKAVISLKQDHKNRGLQHRYENQDKNTGLRYMNLDFWIKLIDDDNAPAFPENINMQIDNLLEKYIK